MSIKSFPEASSRSAYKSSPTHVVMHVLSVSFRSLYKILSSSDDFVIPICLKGRGECFAPHPPFACQKEVPQVACLLYLMWIRLVCLSLHLPRLMLCLLRPTLYPTIRGLKK